ncbi:sensor histidine kinase [Pseudomonas violetae]|uniref:histidine kinase n=1 Tax=Pseudomonas violetae TaxID=2915813 RepID=A0ABT0F0C6_9PSED|nr:ATP-binding protein [Pseudomonas violetae]MCK1791079.1 ATP-binding protein [Pseudomonas violetae]
MPTNYLPGSGTGFLAYETHRLALIEIGERIRDLDDTPTLAYAAAEILGRTLQVSRVGYGTIDPVAETITIERDWNAPGIETLAGVLSFREYGSYIEDLKKSETVVVRDVGEDPRTRESTQQLKAISAHSFINMPIIEKGRPVALLYLNHSEARDWTADELALIREVAERTRMATERCRARDDLRELAASLEHQVQVRTEQLRQSQKMEAVGQLTGRFAHDFNNLLTVIRSSCDLLKRPGSSEERRLRLVEAISEAVERGSSLTGQLLSFARRQALNPSALDVNASVMAIGEAMRLQVGPGVDVVIDELEEICSIHADPGQFETALVNLVKNASDAMHGNGKLIINVTRADGIPATRGDPSIDGNFIAISVSDNGSGIAPFCIERIFEPFFTTKSVGQGTGLGLSQVFGFAKQSGGEIRVESCLGQGSAFTLYLPCA